MTETTLTVEQQQRADALRAAREVIVTRTPGFVGSTDVDAVDLIAVAQFILDGRDPWEAVAAVEELDAPEPADEGFGAIDGLTRTRTWTLTLVPDGEDEES